MAEQEGRKKAKVVQGACRSPVPKATGVEFRPEFKKSSGSLVLASEKGLDPEVAKALLKGIVLPVDREACEVANTVDLQNTVNKAIYGVSLVLL